MVNLNDITYITGFWYIPTNTKRNLDHYKEKIPITFEQLRDCKVIFYYNNGFQRE